MASSGVVTYSSLAWATRVPPQQPTAPKCEPVREPTQDPKPDGFQTPPVRRTTDVPRQPLTYRDIVAQQRATKSAPLKKPLVEAHTEQPWPLPQSARSAPVRTRDLPEVVQNGAAKLLGIANSVKNPFNPMLAFSEVQAKEGHPPDGGSYTSQEFSESYDKLEKGDPQVTFRDSPEVRSCKDKLASDSATAFSAMSKKELTNLYCAQSLLRCGAFLEYVWSLDAAPFNFDGDDSKLIWNIGTIRAELASGMDIQRVQGEIWHGRDAIIAVASGQTDQFRNDLEMLDLIVHKIENLKRQDLVERLMRKMTAVREARDMTKLTVEENVEAQQSLEQALNEYTTPEGETLSQLFRVANDNMGFFTRYLGKDTDFAQSQRLSTLGNTRAPNIMDDTVEIAKMFLEWYNSFELMSKNPAPQDANLSGDVSTIMDTTTNNHSDEVSSALWNLAEVQSSFRYASSERQEGDPLSPIPLERVATPAEVEELIRRTLTDEEQSAYESLRHSESFTSGSDTPQSERQTPRASFTYTPATPPRRALTVTVTSAENVREVASAVNRVRAQEYADKIAALELTFVNSQPKFDSLCQHAGAALSRAVTARHAVAKNPTFATQRGSETGGVDDTFLIQVAEVALARTKLTETQVTPQGVNSASAKKKNLLKALTTAKKKGGPMMLPGLMALPLTWEKCKPTAWHRAMPQNDESSTTEEVPLKLHDRKECARTGPETYSCSAIRVAAELLWPLVYSQDIDWTITPDGHTVYNLSKQPPIHSWPGLMDAHLRAHDVWQNTDETESPMLPQHLQNLSREYEMLTYAIYCARVLKYTQENYKDLYQALTTTVNAADTEFFGLETTIFLNQPTDVNATFDLVEDEPVAQEDDFEAVMLADNTLLRFLCKTIDGLKKATKEGQPAHAGMRVLLFCVHVSHLTEDLLIKREYCSARPTSEILQKLAAVTDTFQQAEPHNVAQLHDPLTVLRHMFDLLCARHALVRYTNKDHCRHEVTSEGMCALSPQRASYTIPKKVFLNQDYLEPHYNDTYKLQQHCAAGNANNAIQVLVTPPLRKLHTMVLMVPHQETTLRDILYSTMAAAVLQSMQSSPTYLTSPVNGFNLDEGQVNAFSVVEEWKGTCNSLVTAQAEVTKTTTRSRSSIPTIEKQLRTKANEVYSKLFSRITHKAKVSGFDGLERTIEEAITTDPHGNFDSLASMLKDKIGGGLAADDASSAQLPQMFAILKDQIRKDNETIEAMYLSLSVPVYPLTPVHAYPFYMGLQPLPDQATLVTMDSAQLIQVATDIGVEEQKIDDAQEQVQTLRSTILEQMDVHRTRDVWSSEWIHTYAAGAQRGGCQVPMHDFRACDPNPGVADKDALLRLREIACTTQVQTHDYERAVRESVQQSDSTVGSLHLILPLEAEKMYVCTRSGLTPEAAEQFVQEIQRSKLVFEARVVGEDEVKREAIGDDKEIQVILNTNLQPGEELNVKIPAARGLNIATHPLYNWRQAIHGLQTTIESASLRHSLMLYDAWYKTADGGVREKTGIGSVYMISHGVTLYARRMEIMTVTILREMGWAMLRAYNNTTYDCSLVTQILSMPESAFHTQDADPVARTAPFAAAVCVLAGCCRGFLQMTKYDLLWEAAILTNEPVDNELFDDDERVYTEFILPHREHDSWLIEFVEMVGDKLTETLQQTAVQTLQEFKIVFVEQLQGHRRWEDIRSAWAQNVASRTTDSKYVIDKFDRAVADMAAPVTLVGKGCTLPLAKNEYKRERLEELFAAADGGGTTLIQKVRSLVETSSAEAVARDLTEDQSFAVDAQADLSTGSDVAPEEQHHLLLLAMNVFRRGAEASDTPSQYVQNILTALPGATDQYIQDAVRKSTVAETALLAQVLPLLTGHGQQYMELSKGDDSWLWQLTAQSDDVKQLSSTLDTRRNDTATQFANATVGVLFDLLPSDNLSDFGKLLQLGMDVFWRVQVLFVHHVLLLRMRFEFVSDQDTEWQRYSAILGRVLDFWAVYSSTCKSHWQRVQQETSLSEPPENAESVAVTIKPTEELPDCWVRYGELTNIPVEFANQVAEIMNRDDLNTAEKLERLRQEKLNVTSIVHNQTPLQNLKQFEVRLQQVTDLPTDLGAEFEHCSFLNVPSPRAKLYKVRIFIQRSQNPFEIGQVNNFPLVRFQAKGRSTATYLQLVDAKDGYLVDFTGDPPTANTVGTGAVLPSSIDSQDGDSDRLYDIDSFRGLTYDRYFQLAANLPHRLADAVTNTALQAGISRDLRKFTLDASAQAYSNSGELFTILRQLSATCLERSFDDKAFGTNATMSTIVQLN